MKTQIDKFMRFEICPDCKGARLKKEALSVTINGKSIVDVATISIEKALNFVDSLDSVLSAREKEIGKMILKEIKQRLSFLVDVGLEYLTLARTAATLAGGE